jgi:hypothetical protein
MNDQADQRPGSSAVMMAVAESLVPDGLAEHHGGDAGTTGAARTGLLDSWDDQGPDLLMAAGGR